MLDRFVDAGGTLVDTADTYGRGESERVLAPWLARRRDDVVLATKVRFATDDPPGAGPVARPHPRRPATPACERLGIDVIDLYQVHAPDPSVPLEETLEALDGLVRAGKVRAHRRLELPGVAARVGGRGAGPQRVGAVRLAAGAVLARRALRRDRGAAVLPRRRPRRPAVGAARRRLPHRPLPPRRGDARRQPDGDRGRRPRGGARAARDRAQLPRRRRGRGDRRRARGHRGAGRDRLAMGVEGVASPIIGPRTMAHLDDLLGAADLDLTADERARPRGAGAAAGPLPAADAHRAGRARRRDRAAAARLT